MAEFPEKEEHYLLRVQDPQASKKLRKLLQQPSAPANAQIEIRFDSKLPFLLVLHVRLYLVMYPFKIWICCSDKEGADVQARTGDLVIQGDVYPAKRLDLPTITETFKTYDDCNLVKSGDIGQVWLLSRPLSKLTTRTPADQVHSSKSEARHHLGRSWEQAWQERVRSCRWFLSLSKVMTCLMDLLARDGITPPMRDACNRRFRKSRNVEPGLMRHVEEAILTIASVSSTTKQALQNCSTHLFLQWSAPEIKCTSVLA